MAEGYEIRNHSSGPAGTTVQFGVNKGNIWFAGPPAWSNVEGARQDRLGDLAAETRSSSDRELEKWGLRGRDALPVRWHTAADDLFDHWTKIQRDAAPISLDGNFTGIRHTYEAVESRRLVILGRAGSGKTVLAHRFILDLSGAGPEGPVPVLFSLGHWNPATELRSWLAGQLIRDFAFLDAPDTSGKKLAEVFVDRGLILPVLDGFDEIPAIHRLAAISKIGSLNLPLILTSRPDEYSRAAREIGAVGGAAAIALEDLSLSESHEYLRQSIGKRRSRMWDAVFDHLRTSPDDLASRNLAAVLTSPLMVVLARIVYNDDPENQLAELLDIERFPTVEHVEDRLLDRYLVTAYAHGSRWQNLNPDQVRHWLTYLATRLQVRRTHDFTWWQLPALLRRRTRILATTAFGLVVGLPHMLTASFALGLGFSLIFGLATGLLNEASFARGRAGREPERLRLYWRRHGRQRRDSQQKRFTRAASEFSNGLASGLVFGLAFGFMFGSVTGRNLLHTLWLANGYDAGVDPAVGYGLDPIAVHTIGGVLALVAGLMIGVARVVVSVLGEGHDPNESDPWQLLSTDRTVTLIRIIITSLAFAPFVALMIPDGLVAALTLGLALWGWVGVLCLMRSAWGNWLLFACLWLPLTGRLPWRLKRFLEDAYDRGVLRRTGSAYQFCHARLRDYLAHQHRRRPADT